MAKHEYDCSVLNGMTEVSVDCGSQLDISAEPVVLHPTLTFSCRDQLNCGIAKKTPQGTIYDWDQCPAHRIAKRGGFL